MSSMYQVEGALITNPVIVNWLLAGLATVRPIQVPTVASTGLPEVTVIVGSAAFEARTGVATGTRINRPEKTRSARTSPELNFVTYSFLRVLKYVFGDRHPRSLYKRSGQFVHF